MLFEPVQGERFSARLTMSVSRAVYDYYKSFPRHERRTLQETYDVVVGPAALELYEKNGVYPVIRFPWETITKVWSDYDSGRGDEVTGVFVRGPLGDEEVTIDIHLQKDWMRWADEKTIAGSEQKLHKMIAEHSKGSEPVK